MEGRSNETCPHCINVIEQNVKNNLINQLSVLWKKWLNCYLSVVGREKFIRCYIDPRKAGIRSEKIFEKNNPMTIKERFLENLITEVKNLHNTW